MNTIESTVFSILSEQKAEELEASKDTFKFLKCNSSFAKQSIACSSIFLSGISMGMTFGFTGTLLPQLPQIDANSGSWLASCVVSIIPLGNISSSIMMRQYGRKITQTVCVAIGISGWLCVAFAHKFWLMLIGCSLLGVSTGYITTVMNIYVVEICEPKYRGIMSLFATGMIAFGVLLSHTLGMLYYWKIALSVSALVPAASLVVCRFFMLETPNWLILKERPEEAETIFYRLRVNTSENERELKTLLNKGTRNLMQKRRGILRNMVSKKFWKPFLVLAVVFLTLIGSGFDIIMMYAVDVLLKMTSKEDHDATGVYIILLDLVRLFSCISSSYWIHVVSRRLLFLTSAAATFFSLILIILSMALQLPHGIRVICVCFYVWSVYAGINPIPWLMATELYPEVVRDMGNGATTIWAFLLTGAIVKAYPLVTNSFGILFTFSSFACIVLVSSIILYFIMPETQNITLQQIEDEVMDKE